jgi:alkylhydroperoxidase family enzyme
VDKVTRTPAKVVPEDLEPLRLVGLDDRGILQVLMICAAFNYLNRIADGIGVGKGTIANPFMP